MAVVVVDVDAYSQSGAGSCQDRGQLSHRVGKRTVGGSGEGAPSGRRSECAGQRAAQPRRPVAIDQRPAVAAVRQAWPGAQPAPEPLRILSTVSSAGSRSPDSMRGTSASLHSRSASNSGVENRDPRAPFRTGAGAHLAKRH